MKPTLSRPAAKIVFFLFFLHFNASSDNNSPFSFLVLGRCGARYEHRNDQTPKASYSSSAQRGWFKASNGINGRGPAAGGKDAVYAGCEIEPTERSATEAGSAL